ncbi:MAG: hypothetical protein E7486_04125 [Ruminococcaceae bacterium]|nr:hypothetical protein [Oscillospiraceae bacterium]
MKQISNGIKKAGLLLLCGALFASLFGCAGQTGGENSGDTGSKDNGFVFSTADSETEQTESSGNNSSGVASREESEVSQGSTSVGGEQMGGEIAVTAKNTTFFGRHYEDTRFDTWFFNWTLGGFQIAFEGSGIEGYFHVPVGADNPDNHPYIGIILDGKRQEDIVVRGDGWVTLAEGLSAGKHTLQVVKLNESMLNSIGIEKFRLPSNGKLLAPPELPNRKIEIIGDSITCGYGNIPPYNAPALTSAIEDGLQTYGSFIKEHFSADVRIESISGGAVYRDYLGNVSALFSKYKQCDYYDITPYDFSEWTPELVIINLGTNDFGQGSTREEFLDGGKRWIDFLREKYGKDTQIIWTYGVMNQQCDGYIEELVEYYHNHGDTKIAYVPLEMIKTDTEGVGSGGHPTVKTHRRIADTLIPEIEKIMGW